jgi:hypothetical protein
MRKSVHLRSFLGVWIILASGEVDVRNEANFSTPVTGKLRRGDAEKNVRGEELGGIRGRAGIGDLHCWNGGFESAETAEIKDTSGV